MQDHCSTKTLSRRFFRLTIPNILSNVTVPLVGLVDAAMLGHLPDIRFLAGVALASIIFDYVYWTFGFFRMGTTGMTAQAVGRGDREGLYLVLFRSLLLAGIIAACLLVLQRAIAAAGFALLAGTPGVEAAGRAYFKARIWGAPAVLGNFVLLGWFLGRERSTFALVMTVVANVANAVLDYVFLFQLHLAAFGAGLATTLSQYLSLLVALGLLLRMRDRVPIGWRRVVDRRALFGILHLNLDITIRTLCLISAFAVFTNYSAALGVELLAANAVLLRILNFAAYFIDGAAFATESLTGIFYGQGDFKSLQWVLKYSLLVGEFFAFAMIAALLVAPDNFYHLLTSHESINRVIQQYDLYVAVVLAFSAAAYIFDGFFIGLVRGRILRNSMLISTLFVFLPVAFLGKRMQSNDILWLSMVLFMLARAATLGHASWGMWHRGELRAPPAS